jgi:putative intracellular protease/amidase
MNDPIDRRSFAAMGLIGATAMLAGSARAQSSHAGHMVQGDTMTQAKDSTGIRGDKKTKVTILLYDGTAVLDWAGPHEALARVPNVEVVLAGKTTDMMKSDTGIVQYKANVTLDQVESSDVLIVPGGAQGLMAAMNDPAIVDWVKKIDKTTIYTVGVCTGSLFLANIGLLKGKRASTYWKFTNMLANSGAIFVPGERWVRDGKYWTSAGISAGIDETLALIADLYGPMAAMKAQLAIEYDPHPPFNSGSLRTAPKAVVDALGGVMAPHPM